MRQILDVVGPRAVYPEFFADIVTRMQDSELLRVAGNRPALSADGYRLRLALDAAKRLLSGMPCLRCYIKRPGYLTWM
jgi:hypothetical protein